MFGASGWGSSATRCARRSTSCSSRRSSRIWGGSPLGLARDRPSRGGVPRGRQGKDAPGPRVGAARRALPPPFRPCWSVGWFVDPDLGGARRDRRSTFHLGRRRATSSRAQVPYCRLNRQKNYSTCTIVTGCTPSPLRSSRAEFKALRTASSCLSASASAWASTPLPFFVCGSVICHNSPCAALPWGRLVREFGAARSPVT